MWRAFGGGDAAAKALDERLRDFDGGADGGGGGASAMASPVLAAAPAPAAASGAGGGGSATPGVRFDVAGLLSPVAVPVRATAHSHAELKERRKQWYASRFKFLKAKLAGDPRIARILTKSVGIFPSLEYRMTYWYSEADGEPQVQISPWHDVPLRNGDGTLNFIVEIPKWTRR